MNTWHVLTAVLPVLAYLGASLTDSEALTDAFWALSYIAEDTPAEAQARAVSSAGLLPLLCAAYDRHEAAQELQSEVVWALASMAGKQSPSSLASSVVSAGGCRVLGSHLAARAWSAEGRDVRAV
ncbi:hypothetical protein HYH03_012850 [Edaphochlamys debaryana]|uniref:Uncharacterized protein n=1 Tax=Edaphochlamys debaryana TaxID=47281 RepID=A0A836BTN4_9CHLO|nr:hypothetical protein HYH03_012850 [Edaphochlamys debaryana]|eukprot:KAG2488530.1 hypothetical protein HYH03_012850 [Edaphochlamys debaryana]